MKSSFFFASPTAVLGGAERIMFNLIKFLLAEGHQVTFYVMSRGLQDGWEELLKEPNFKIIIRNYNSEKTSLPAFLLNLILLSYKNEFDYAFSSHTHVNGTLSLMRKLKLFKTNYLISRESTLVFERYQGAFARLLKLIYKYMYGSQDLVICQTNEMKASLVKHLGFKPANRIEVIPNPVNLNYIESQLNNATITTKPFHTLIVACGRFIELKKFDHLISAFHMIEEEFPKVGLVLIGDGPERNNLQKLVSKFRLQKKVMFTGKIHNPIQWFNKADIGIISSEIEGFPNVLIEMMAAGTKKVISTPCTDEVNNIPYITVAKSCSVEDLQKSMRDNLKEPVDNSTDYVKYIKANRSVEVFWKTVKEYLD